MPKETPHSGREVAQGVALVLVFHCAFLTGLVKLGDAMVRNMPPWLANVFVWSLAGFGVTQMIYIGPAIWYYRRKQRPGVVKGLIIAAAVTALLNGMCWALFRS